MNSSRKRKVPYKIGVFIVAYNANSTINNVLDRIKHETWKKISEVYIFDDASNDNTSKTAVKHIRNQNLRKVKIFKNTVNLGYGGNQKRGYLYAIRNKFDIVVLLHGDGQYAPEYLDDLINPLLENKADAVFGSRMISKLQALKGGMPLYKFAGNIILTEFQNMMMNRNLSEYHSGYRAYKVSVLSQLPFVRNSNDFHFDNEIIIQLMYGGYRIKEVKIPTYYGDEICYVNGLFYAWNILKNIIHFKLHQAGLQYYPQYDVLGSRKYVFKPNPYSSHNQIYRIIEKKSAGHKWTILDLGCGRGLLAEKIHRVLHHEITGVDRDPIQKQRNIFKKYITADIERDFRIPSSLKFDCIILADILEHTRNPEDIVIRSRAHLKPGGVMIASTGNVANITIRIQMLLGQFNYTERGILDATHTHLFTRHSFIKLFRMCGMKVINVGSTPIPFDLIIPNYPRVNSFLCSINQMLNGIFPSLFAYQTIVTVIPDTKVPDLLRSITISDQMFSEFTS